MEKDACELCDGEAGGEPGNENYVGGTQGPDGQWTGGKLACDYCTAWMMALSISRPGLSQIRLAKLVAKLRDWERGVRPRGRPYYGRNRPTWWDLTEPKEYVE